MSERFFPLSDHTPYSDRKLTRDEEAVLDIEIIVGIQQMACLGKKPYDILQVYGSQGVSMDQIMKALDPLDEWDDAKRGCRRPERAEVGYAKLKGRR